MFLWIFITRHTQEGGKMLTPEQLEQAIEEFKVLYKKQYGRELSDEEATEQVKDLLQMFADLFQLPTVAQC